MIAIGIIIAVLCVILLIVILDGDTEQHHLNMENTFKIFLRRAEQRAYIYWYGIEPRLALEHDNLIYYDTPAGTIYVKRDPEKLTYNLPYLTQEDWDNFRRDLITDLTN